MRQVFDSFAGFDDFLVYLAVALVLLGLFIAIYIRVTPYREIALIREGNMAAAFSLSGSILGFVIPNIGRDIPENRTAQGFFLGAMSVAVGVLNAACMSY